MTDKTKVASSTKVRADSASFEQILDRLGHVVEKLEAGDLALEDSLVLFEEGVRLSRQGSQRLDEAERRVEVLLSEGEGIRTEVMQPPE